MSDTREGPLLARLRLKYHGRFDAVMMLVYLGIVYACGLTVHPLGRDYAILEHAGEGLPFLAQALFAAEMHAFGAHAAGYHIVNLTVLYACLLCLYNFANRCVKGLWWLGTLAALMFMANPVHTEAVLNLSGIADLLPCLAALLALVAYASYVDKPTPGRWVLALGLFALAAWPYRANAFLVLVVVLYELLIASGAPRRCRRLAPFVALGLVGLVLHARGMLSEGLSPSRMFGPLYLILYPFGLLPETARTLHDWPWLGWLGAAAVVLVAAFIHRKARRPAIVFGLLAMAAVRLAQGERFVDPVHMIGGGQLLLANALFNIGLVALFYRMMDHPRWRVTIIGGTTLLCAAFFLFQIRSNLAWREASTWVRIFQDDASHKVRNEPLALCPDYQYYRGAPVCLSEAVLHDTAFSKALRVVPVLPLHAERPERMCVSLLQWTPQAARVVVEGTRPLDVVPWPYVFSRPGTPYNAGSVILELLDEQQGHFTVAIKPTHGTLPRNVLPGRVAYLVLYSPFPGMKLGLAIAPSTSHGYPKRPVDAPGGREFIRPDEGGPGIRGCLPDPEAAKG